MLEFKFLVWPLLILILCILFKDPISKLVSPDNMAEMQVEIGISGVKIKKIAAAAAEVAAKTAKAAQENQNVIDQSALANNLATGIELSLINKPKNTTAASILWVDDTPSNNTYLVNAFEELQIKVDVVKSTSEAESKLSNNKYDMVITDMSRPPVSEAGLELISYIKRNGFETQVIIYAAKWAAAHKGQEKLTGAVLITDNPSEVYSTVLKSFLSSNR